MNEPEITSQENKKTIRFSEPVGQIRIAEWMSLEARSKNLEEEERRMEEDARLLEKYIRELARTPQQLVLQKPRLQQEALDIRRRREDILRSRRALEEERRIFWKSDRPKSRTSLSVEVSATSESNFYTGISGDIEEGGLFIATHQNHQPGTLIELTLSLPGQPPMQLAGEVRWVREYNEFTEDVEPAAFMNARPPLFYDMD
jgi:Tfp pilus assembly protein PilZ